MTSGRTAVSVMRNWLKKLMPRQTDSVQQPASAFSPEDYDIAALRWVHSRGLPYVGTFSTADVVQQAKQAIPRIAIEVDRHTDRKFKRLCHKWLEHYRTYAIPEAEHELSTGAWQKGFDERVQQRAQEDARRDELLQRMIDQYPAQTP